MKQMSVFFLSLLLLVSCASTPPSPENYLILASNERPREDRTEAVGTKFALSTQGSYSTQAARDILAEGGNLIDAAVTASFVLSVERPQSTGIAGGGFMLYREASTQKIYAIDFRERAPLKSEERMFLGADGQPDSKLSQDGILASGVPGMVAGLSEIHQRFGKLPWERLVKPAIDLAERGFPVYPHLAAALEARAAALAREPAAKNIYLKKDGSPLKAGEILAQRDLARTLREIARKQRDGFYKGPVAQKFLAYFRQKQGLITEKDFADYEVKWREPVRGRYQGHDIVSMPPPSSGGVHVIQVLNFVERDALQTKGFLSANSIHLAASALQSAFADRAQYMGDPDFVKVPVQGLISKDYAGVLRSKVVMDKARSADQVSAGDPLPYESQETTHFSMIDHEGNMVASTQTINGWMGSGLVVPGTGLVLNNEMDDFSAATGAQNLFGAVGGAANAVAPKKTPLSSMAPTLVLKDEKPVMALGAPGGTRIISCVAQTILNSLEFRMPLFESVASVRYHHQWKPDILQLDPPGPAPEVLKALEELGYKVDVKPTGCFVMAVARESTPEANILRAVADPRDIGTSQAE